MDTNRQDDIRRLALQEEMLQFETFDKSSAWALGLHLKSACETVGVSTTIEIRIAQETVFLYSMEGTSPSNADWARRKRNVVEMMFQSSYAMGLLCDEKGESLEDIMGLPPRDYACHGGAFPINVKGVGCIGVVTVSGLPQRADHIMVVEAVAQMCGVELSEVALQVR